MVDTDTNVTPLPVKTKRADNTAALRQRRSRAKRKRVIRAQTSQIAQFEKPSRIKADVTVSRGAKNAADVTDVAPPRRTNYALVVIAYGFFLLGIGITYGTPRRAARSPTWRSRQPWAS
jgi:hypothetical protein